MKKLRISRYSGAMDVELREWRDLIAALVMVGYEVYADKDAITFSLSDCDEIIEE